MKKHLLVSMLALIPVAARADIMSLDDALRATYVECVGIDDKLADYKKMAGINTAITGVGAGLGAGAVATGIIKAKKDAEIRTYEEVLAEYEKQAQERGYEDTVLTQEEQDKGMAEFEAALKASASMTEDEYNKLNEQSKKLGNWRTGLLAGNVATNVAGAIIASKNGANGDIQEMIDGCLAAVNDLNNAIGQARINGQDVTEAQNIVSACREYETVNVSSIVKRARGAEVSSIVGAGVGAAGVVTSAVANTDKIRDDNSDAGHNREKNLNTAANVMAGGATVASVAATAFNASQIAAIKRVATVAANCEGVLK